MSCPIHSCICLRSSCSQMYVITRPSAPRRCPRTRPFRTWHCVQVSRALFRRPLRSRHPPPATSLVRLWSHPLRTDKDTGEGDVERVKSTPRHLRWRLACSGSPALLPPAGSSGAAVSPSFVSLLLRVERLMVSVSPRFFCLFRLNTHDADSRVSLVDHHCLQRSGGRAGVGDAYVHAAVAWEIYIYINCTRA